MQEKEKERECERESKRPGDETRRKSTGASTFRAVTRSLLVKQVWKAEQSSPSLPQRNLAVGCVHSLGGLLFQTPNSAQVYEVEVRALSLRFCVDLIQLVLSPCPLSLLLS